MEHTSILCITLIKLAYDLQDQGAPQVMEILFTAELIFVLLSVAHMKFVTRDYLFSVANKDLALSLAHRIALYTAINTACLATLSFFTFSTIQIVCSVHSKRKNRWTVLGLLIFALIIEAF